MLKWMQNIPKVRRVQIMSKVLIINGSPRLNGNTAIAVREMEKVFHENGVEVTTVQIGNKDIRGCIAC